MAIQLVDAVDADGSYVGPSALMQLLWVFERFDSLAWRASDHSLAYSGWTSLSQRHWKKHEKAGLRPVGGWAKHLEAPRLKTWFTRKVTRLG